MKQVEIVQALEAIRHADGGVLQPERVVTEAAAKDHPLHGQFMWDDTVAGHQYRIWQARRMIDTCVTVLAATGKRMKVYVSLSGDRKDEGGGYRALVEVMGKKTYREQLLAEALAKLNRFQEEYRDLEELSEVFAAARRVRSGVPA